MKTRRSAPPTFLLDTSSPKVSTSVSELLREMKSFEGRTFQDMMDEIEELNRRETREERRKLRVELAERFAEGTETELPHGLLPSEIRRQLFSAVWERGLGFVAAEPDLFRPSSEQIYAAVAQRLNVEHALLRKATYADIREAQTVSISRDAEKASISAIIGTLNLSRLKQRLRRAVSVRLEIPQSVEQGSPYVSILWSLKRERLMYDAGIEGGTLVLSVRGPGAMFEKSTMYGNRLASFAGSFLRDASPGLSWLLEAEIMERAGDSVTTLHLDSTMRGYFPAIGGEPGDDFKSSDEAAFQRYFERLECGWELKYEATIIPLTRTDGTRAGFMIPDFVARNIQDGRSMLIEIVGFWKDEYLRRKVEKVRLLASAMGSAGPRIILVVNEALRASRGALDLCSAQEGSDVLFYSGRNELKAAAAKVAHILKNSESGG